MHALKTSKDTLKDKMKYDYNIYSCSKHFYPSVLSIYPNKQIILQVGEFLALCMSTYSTNNEKQANNKALLQTIVLEAENDKLKLIINKEEIPKSKNIDNK